MPSHIFSLVILLDNSLPVRYMTGFKIGDVDFMALPDTVYYSALPGERKFGSLQT